MSLLTETDNEKIIYRCLNVPFEELDPLFDEAYRVSRKKFGERIVFYMPGMIHFDTEFYKTTNPYSFPSISLTGTECRLMCEHCKGKLLETMIPATSPELLYEVCMRIKDKGGQGCLISGGSDPNGAVPITRFLPMIKRIKEELGLKMVVHTGVVSPETAVGLGEVGVEGVMLDVIGSNETLRSIYHLDQTIEMFDRSLALLEQARVPVIPHIVVGLDHGEIKGEGKAISIIAKHKPDAVVVVAFMPLDNTPMCGIKPPTPEEIVRVLLTVRMCLQDIPLLLGCARPRGEHKSITDVLSIKAGVNGIAYPSQEGYDYSKELGLDIEYNELCCSMIYKDFENRSR